MSLNRTCGRFAVIVYAWVGDVAAIGADLGPGYFHSDFFAPNGKRMRDRCVGRKELLSRNVDQLAGALRTGSHARTTVSAALLLGGVGTAVIALFVLES